MPKPGKLAKLAEDRRVLRAENRSLTEERDGWMEGYQDIEGLCPSRLRRFIGSGIKDGVSYGGGRAYVKLQMMGWMPRFPLDGVVGFGTQMASAFFPGAVARVFHDIGDGMACGALGRLAFQHQAEQTVVSGRVVYFRPGATAPPAGE